MFQEFQFGKIKDFWKWMVVMVAQHVAVRNATVLNVH